MTEETHEARKVEMMYRNVLILAGFELHLRHLACDMIDPLDRNASREARDIPICTIWRDEEAERGIKRTL